MSVSFSIMVFILIALAVVATFVEEEDDDWLD